MTIRLTTDVTDPGTLLYHTSIQRWNVVHGTRS